ncbi:hypothetical protein PQX77_014039 [Marasmius sp. AFHP31]|nr:hypothetical protein PQX77_014039 [Marasmius sp. AFHP31]
MITRSSPPLARLKLEITRIQDIQPSELPVLPFLESFCSTLTHLEIEVTTERGTIQKYRDLVDPFVEGLFSKLQETEFLPLLNSITLVVEEISITNEVVDAVLKIASQRQAAVVPLRSFSLTRYTHQRIGPAFRKLAMEPQEMVQRIRELHQRFRVSVNFEERDYKNAEDRTMRINTGDYISSPWEDSDEA